MTTRPERIATLDGWRAIAILGVFASHSVHVLPKADSAAGLAVVATHLRLGVDLFFAISGFLITTLLLREQARGELSLDRFYVRRAFRILPLVLTYLALLSILDLFWPVVHGWEVLSSLLFARNYLTHWPGPATNHFWSLSVEEHFYLLWPPALLWLGPKRALRFAIGAALLCSLWRALDARSALFARLFSEDAGVLFRTDTRFDALLWGAVAAFAAPRWSEFARRFPLLPTTAFSLGAIVLWEIARLPFQPTALAILFPLLILSTVLRPDAFVSHALELPALTRIGRLSYSLYVWQTLFLQVETVSFSRRAMASGTPVLPAYLLDLALTVCAAMLSHKLVELPAQNYGRRRAAELTLGTA